MTRLHASAALLLVALALTGCTPSDPVATPDPVASDPGIDRPTPTATATASPSAAPPASADPLSVPCDDLLTRAEVEGFLSPAAQSLGDTSTPGGAGHGSNVVDIIALMPDGATTNCTWVVPDSDGGFIVSVIAADAPTRAAVVAALPGVETDVVGGVRHLTLRGLDAISYTEVHALSETDDLWVAVYSTSDGARAISDAVWARLTR